MKYTGRKIRRFFVIALSFASGFAIILGLLHFVGFRKVVNILSGITLGKIGLAYTAYLGAWALRSIRLRLLSLHLGHPLSLLSLGKIRIASYALNTLLPAKLGEIASIAFLRLRGLKTGAAMAMIFQERIMDIMGLVLLSAPALILYLKGELPSWILMILVSGVLLSLTPFFLLAWDRNRRMSIFFDHLLEKIRPKMLNLVVRKVEDASNAYISLISDRKIISPLIFFSLAIWLMEGMVCFIISRGLGVYISLPAVLLAVALANAGRIVPVTPGAMGIYEGILAALLNLFGVPFDIAAAIAILDQMIQKSFNLVIGVPCAINLGFSLHKIYDLVRQELGNPGFENPAPQVDNH